MRIKIAIPTRNNEVDDHFGHCEYYTLVSVEEDNTIGAIESFEAPVGCGCKSDVASVLKAKGVSVMLAGNMGQGALNKVSAEGIDVVRGCSGNVNDLVRQYLDGVIADSGETCASHEDHHSHGFRLDDGHVCSHN